MGRRQAPCKNHGNHATPDYADSPSSQGVALGCHILPRGGWEGSGNEDAGVRVSGGDAAGSVTPGATGRGKLQVRCLPPHGAKLH